VAHRRKVFPFSLEAVVFGDGKNEVMQSGSGRSLHPSRRLFLNADRAKDKDGISRRAVSRNLKTLQHTCCEHKVNHQLEDRLKCYFKTSRSTSGRGTGIARKGGDFRKNRMDKVRRSNVVWTGGTGQQKKTRQKVAPRTSVRYPCSQVM